MVWELQYSMIEIYKFRGQFDTVLTYWTDGKFDTTTPVVLKFWIVGHIYSIKHSFFCEVYCKSNLKDFAYKFLTQVQEPLKREVQDVSDIWEGHLTSGLSFGYTRASATIVFTKPHEIKMFNLPNRGSINNW